MYTIKGKYSTATIMTDETSIDQKVYEQILQMVNCHVFSNDSKIMPDYHWGKGSVIGFTMPLTDKIIPNVVGVDIGCNMLFLNLTKNLKLDSDQWRDLDRRIRAEIPMAQKHRQKPALKITDYPWKINTVGWNNVTSYLNEKFGWDFKSEDYTVDWFFDLCERVNCKPVVAVNSLGSLGGGNHFIEFGTSQRTGNTCCTVHSGSRNLGLKVCNYWQKKAKENLKKRYNVDFQKTIKEIKANNPPERWETLIKAAKHPPTPTGLEYLEGEDMYGYLRDMYFCQHYAYHNILYMMASILNILNMRVTELGNSVHTIHNYVSFDDFIIRKGAVASYKDTKIIIPFNMEDGILICEGLSNEEWNFSAPHGAGRLFGRREIKQNQDIKVPDIKSRMKKKGIHISIVPKDEIKEAYKDAQFIEDAISPTAKVIDRIKPIMTLKADD